MWYVCVCVCIYIYICIENSFMNFTNNIFHIPICFTYFWLKLMSIHVNVNVTVNSKLKSKSFIYQLMHNGVALKEY